MQAVSRIDPSNIDEHEKSCKQSAVMFKIPGRNNKLQINQLPECPAKMSLALLSFFNSSDPVVD